MKRLVKSVVALIALFSLGSLGGCAHHTEETKPAAAAPAPTAPPKADAKLYDRLGGLPAIEAVIDDFLARVAADERINAGFAASNIPKVRKRLVELVCQASGGPCTYSGRDMKTAHAGMGVTGAQFDALAGHLVEALDKFKVPAREKGELLAVVAPMKTDIVEEP